MSYVMNFAPLRNLAFARRVEVSLRPASFPASFRFVLPGGPGSAPTGGTKEA